MFIGRPHLVEPDERCLDRREDLHLDVELFQINGEMYGPLPAAAKFSQRLPAASVVHPDHS